MAAKKRVIVAGAGGVFGQLLVAELGGFDVVATTRAELDLRDPGAVARVARGAYAFACAAGPFQDLDPRIVHAVVNEGTHWLDISDDAAWFFGLLDDRTLDAAAKEHGVAVIPGLSTLPAISGALARRVMPASEIDITLFIGNRNRKGRAAIASAAMSGGTLDSPDRELLRRELGVDATARVKLELPGARLLMHVASPALLARIGGAFSFFGTRGGYVEVRAGEKRARLTGRDQRIAILPLVFALHHELPPGVHAPSVFDAGELLSWLEGCV